VLIFAGSSVLFFFMVASKIQLLLSKDNKVDVNVDYPSQLPFPAVTVCNQNKYRYVARVSPADACFLVAVPEDFRFTNCELQIADDITFAAL
jgi:Amiloride-sensitive sodium channel